MRENNLLSIAAAAVADDGETNLMWGTDGVRVFTAIQICVFTAFSDVP